VKPWVVGLMSACVVLIAVGTVVGVVLWVADRADTRLEQEQRKQLLNQIAACERGNDLRRTVQVTIEILDDFTQAAAVARAAASLDANATPEEQRRDAAAAAKYKALGDRLQPVPVVACAKLFQHTPDEGGSR
jgi:hypothetical protein